MKLNIRSAAIIAAIVFAVCNIINPIVNGFGNNLSLVAIVSLLICLAGHLLYVATGELAQMVDVQPAVDKIITYDGIIPILDGKQVLMAAPAPLEGFQFIYKTAGLMAIGFIPVGRDDIEFLSSKEDKEVSVVEIRYTWASAVWQFFANCPKVSAWQVIVPDDEILPEEVPEL